MTIPFKGKSRVKIYNPCKPQKWGLQLRALCDSYTKYVYSLKFWDGNKTSHQDVIKYLISGLENCNHHLFMDNLYNSYETTLFLLSLGFYVTGTLRKRRGGPCFMNIPRIKSVTKTSIFPFTKNQVNSLVYYDSKPVTLISTFHGIQNDKIKDRFEIKIHDSNITGYFTESKPEMIKNYNKFMGGIDIVDQELKYYSPHRKTDRWTFKFAIHILQIMLFNSFVLYKENCKDEVKHTYSEYILLAVEWFVDWGQDIIQEEKIMNSNNSKKFEDTFDIPSDGRNNCKIFDDNFSVFNHENLIEIEDDVLKIGKCLSSGIHNPVIKSSENDHKMKPSAISRGFDRKIHIPEVLNKRARFSLCYKEGKEVKTIWHCSLCKKNLCISKSRLCWFKYHSGLLLEASSDE